MKLPLNRFLIIATLASVAVLLVLIFSLIWFTSRLAPEETRFLVRLIKEHLEIFLGTGFLLCIILAWATDIVYRSYIQPIRQIKEETSLLHTKNPAHRITARGAPEIRDLCHQINENADRYKAIENSIQDKIQFARAASEQEKNILAAIVAELSEGVIICNPDGQILLCNNRAKDMLNVNEAHNETVDMVGQQKTSFIGLGRSVFSMIDEHLILHALSEINQKLKLNKPDAVSYFVVSGVNESLLRVETIPILNTENQFSGYILIFVDITRKLEIDQRLKRLFGSITRGIRGSLSAIRAAAEAIIEYPEMAPAKRETFQEIIHEESVKISNIIETDVSTYAGQYDTQWPLVQTLLMGFLNKLRMKASEKLGIELRLEAIPDDIDLRIDGYSFSLTLLFLLNSPESIWHRRVDPVHAWAVF